MLFRSHFLKISLFLAMFQVLQCVYLIFHDFQCFSPHSRSYQLIFSVSELVIFLDIFQVQHCAFLIFHGFHCFLPYSRSYSVCVSHFPRFFFSFLAIIQVLLFEFVIFLVGQFYRHIPGPTVCIFHFYLFQCFSPFSRSYILCVSFSTFLGFLTIPQFLHWPFLIFQVF